MSFLILILFVILVYRQSSGKANYHPIFLWMAYILTLGTILIVAYIGYTQNPNHNKLKFREVL